MEKPYKFFEITVIKIYNNFQKHFYTVFLKNLMKYGKTVIIFWKNRYKNREVRACTTSDGRGNYQYGKQV